MDLARDDDSTVIMAVRILEPTQPAAGARHVFTTKTDVMIQKRRLSRMLLRAMGRML